MSDDTLEMARESYTVAYVTAACATTLLYDYLITTGDEIRRIWPARFSLPKVLFLANRYIVIPMLVFNGIISTRNHLSAGICVFDLRWFDVTLTVSNAVVEGILLTRIWALYRSTKIIIYISSFFYFGGIGTLVGLTIKDYVGESVLIVEDFSALPGCFAASVPNIIAGFWITPLLVESAFFILVIWRWVSWSRDYTKAPPALVLMARDSTIYFFGVFVLLFVNLFVFEYAPPFLAGLFVTPVSTVGCLAGSRMLLNLREIGDLNSNDTYFEMEHMSAFKASGKHQSKPIAASKASTTLKWADSNAEGGGKPLTTPKTAVEETLDNGGVISIRGSESFDLPPLEVVDTLGSPRFAHGAV